MLLRPTAWSAWFQSHKHRGGAQETCPFRSVSQALLPAESLWAPVLEEGPVPEAQSPADECPGWALPNGVATVPSRGAIQAGLASSEGLLAAQPGSGHRAQGRAGHTPLGCCPAMPSPVGHGWGCKAKSGRSCPHPSTPGWETEARGLAQAPPVQFMEPSILAASRCTTHSVCKAASTVPGKQQGRVTVLGSISVIIISMTTPREQRPREGK